MSDTPETDFAYEIAIISAATGDFLPIATAMLKQAKKLEHERDEAREKYFVMRDLGNNATELAEKYKRERDELKEALLIMENLLEPGIELFPEIGEILKIGGAK